MKQRTWVILTVALMVLGLGGWYYWRLTKTPSETSQGLKPELSVASVAITDISSDRIRLTVKALLRNPSPVEVSSNRLAYSLRIDSVEVLKNSYTRPLTLRASDSTVLELPMEILAKPLREVLERFKNRRIDSANYTFAAALYANVPIAGERKFDFTQTKRLPAFRIPEVKWIRLNCLSWG